MVERAAPAGLSETWKRALDDPDPVGALRASRVLFKEIGAWQSELVAEALAGGATWEDIGAALGTTRQAAWARFRSIAEDTERRMNPMSEQIEAVRDRLQQEMSSLRDEIKALDDKWKQERNDAQQRLRAMAQRRTEERKALQEQIRKTKATLREEVQRLRRSEP